MGKEIPADIPMALLLPGWGNEELQIYASENASVSGGVLSLTATKEDSCFKSAKICTKGKRDFCPNASTPNGIRIEARIKLPRGGLDLHCLACITRKEMLGREKQEPFLWTACI